MNDIERAQVKQILADGIERPLFNGTKGRIRSDVYQLWLASKSDAVAQKSLAKVLGLIDDLTLEDVHERSR